MKNKKLFTTGFLTLVAAAAPMTAMISCGNGGVKIAHINLNRLEPMDFKDIPADGVEWNHGVPYHASSQGFSYLFNLGKLMGWTPSADNDKVTGVVNEDDYQKGKSTPTPLETQTLQNGLNALADPITSAAWSGKTIKDALQDDKGVLDHRFLPFAKVSKIEVATDANILSEKNIVKHISLELKNAQDDMDPSQYNILNGMISTEVSEKLNANKILFDINDAKKIMNIWIVGDKTIPTDITKKIFDGIKFIDQSNNPIQNLRLDPTGSDGTLGIGSAGDTFDVTKPSGVNSEDVTYVDVSNTKIDVHTYATNLNLMALGSNVSGGNGAWKYPNAQATDVEDIEASHFSTYIDGIGNRATGKIIFKLWFSLLGETFSKTFESEANHYRTFDIVDKSTMDILKENVLKVLENLPALPDKSIDSMTMVLNEDTASLIRFFKNINVKDETTKNKLIAAIDKLNNGSHHLVAVNAFFTGIKNIPKTEMPKNPNTNQTEGGSELKGFYAIDDQNELIKWFHFNVDHEHSYKK